MLNAQFKLLHQTAQLSSLQFSLVFHKFCIYDIEHIFILS